MHVFISYSRRDQASITQLRADFERLGHQVWFDRQSHGGQQWWDEVLHHVRGCVVFVFAVSPDSIRSSACLAELRYAAALRRPILPVVVSRVPRADIPEGLGTGAVDYTERSAETAISLLKAFNALPMAKPLTSRLPQEPEIPATYLHAYLDRIDADELAEEDQVELLDQLRTRLTDEHERPEVWNLLVRLRGRPGLTGPVADAIEDLLSPGWQPDPQGRFEARYWDGQAWTTLVVQHGQEFDDRGRPPRVDVEPRRLTDATELLPRAVVARAPEAPVPRRKKTFPWLVATGVILVAGGIAGGLLLLGGTGPDPGSAVHVARKFVDAVNTRDDQAMQQYVCTADLEKNRHLYGAFFDTANVTLESVDAHGDEPRFTILAARTIGNSSVTLSIPLADQNGEWRVCDIDKALSGR
ncbi:Rv0361 family membrane protein [Actinokineospora xionganensis]|uniref:TIR domain-containing protein n=1 Tax=Actinokineospora xionganensis TaxID=2684470 RepID=A0ABR7LBE4_9PSEU|nr:TIR domain-containing protein [Actinokineospora xionganensis]MBC6449987.1 TIR domain-containing protein [Actinokineospora xionganensis]